MYRLGLITVLAFFIACNNNGAEDDNDSVFSINNFSAKFKAVQVPYVLPDTALKNLSDTTTLRNSVFLSYIPDSIKQKIFGKTTSIKYAPIAFLNNKNKEKYFVVRAFTSQKSAALLFVFDKDDQFGAVFPFLIPDNDNKTTQTSSIDKSFSVSRNITKHQTNDIAKEGKDVYAYSPELRQFTLIMTDLLEDKNAEVINPIDTFAKTNKLAGDFALDNRNIVSIRDGRNDKSLTVFVHIEKDNGDCVGEIKGDAVLTSTTTAVYRQGGDPCVLEFTFNKNSVTLKEIEGCGSRRDLRCVFDGTFKRKKEAVKDATATSKGKS